MPSNQPRQCLGVAMSCVTWHQGNKDSFQIMEVDHLRIWKGKSECFYIPYRMPLFIYIHLCYFILRNRFILEDEDSERALSSAFFCGDIIISEEHAFLMKSEKGDWLSIEVFRAGVVQNIYIYIWLVLRP